MITAHSLTKRYGDATAVDDLTFEVPSGEVTGFLGPNGSGKSTTMRMIMGLDLPDSGSALINGRSYGELDWPLREVGALLDAKAFHPARTARRMVPPVKMASSSGWACSVTSTGLTTESPTGCPPAGPLGSGWSSSDRAGSGERGARGIPAIYGNTTDLVKIPGDHSPATLVLDGASRPRRSSEVRE